MENSVCVEVKWPVSAHPGERIAACRLAVDKGERELRARAKKAGVKIKAPKCRKIRGPITGYGGITVCVYEVGAEMETEERPQF